MISPHQSHPTNRDPRILMLIFVATGQYRIVFSGGKITVEQKQSPDNSTTEI